jgi:hypothetical protein
MGSVQEYMDLFISRWRKATNINTPGMPSSLRKNMLANCLSTPAVNYKQKNSYLLSHCLRLHDEGIELIQKNKFDYKPESNLVPDVK